MKSTFIRGQHVATAGAPGSRAEGRQRGAGHLQPNPQPGAGRAPRGFESEAGRGFPRFSRFCCGPPFGIWPHGGFVRWCECVCVEIFPRFASGVGGPFCWTRSQKDDHHSPEKEKMRVNVVISGSMFGRVPWSVTGSSYFYDEFHEARWGPKPPNCPVWWAQMAIASPLPPIASHVASPVASHVASPVASHCLPSLSLAEAILRSIMPFSDIQQRAMKKTK